MQIFGIGYKSAASTDYEYRLLQAFQSHLPNLLIQNSLPESADVLIVNLDIENGYRFFGHGDMPPQQAFTVIIVHELDRSLLPYLKLADLLVFSNELQKRVCEDLIGVSYPSLVLPLPTGDFFPKKLEQGACLIYRELAFKEEQIDWIVADARTAFWDNQEQDINAYHLVLPGPARSNKQWHRLEIELKKISPLFHLHNALRIDRPSFISLLQSSIAGHYLSPSLAQSQFDEYMQARTSGVIHTTLKDLRILADFQHAGLRTPSFDFVDAWNFRHQIKSTFVEFCSRITAQINEQLPIHLEAKKQRFAHVQIDQLADLNVIYGQPLANRYVFSICFRNQEQKIARCLSSIAIQNHNLDFGVVLVDDCSNDQSRQVILDFLSQHPELPACVVSNPINRRAARNFYNVIHLLTINPETVIMEVDGDDFLANDQVLDVLERYYSNGALKTNGSYQIFPDDQKYMKIEDIQRHHSHLDYQQPWSIDYCNSWLHLRTSKRKLATQVELEYYMDRHRNDWLLDRHDAAIQPRIIELSQGHAQFVSETLYRYDLSGDNHDHDNAQREEEYIKMFFHLDKIWHSLPLCPSI